ncbi:MAG: hypothetical protein ABGZ35_15145, partial [Planctomycetaceae bacterium]
AIPFLDRQEVRLVKLSAMNNDPCSFRGSYHKDTNCALTLQDQWPQPHRSEHESCKCIGTFAAIPASQPQGPPNAGHRNDHGERNIRSLREATR